MLIYLCKIMMNFSINQQKSRNLTTFAGQSPLFDNILSLA